MYMYMFYMMDTLSIIFQLILYIIFPPILSMRKIYASKHMRTKCRQILLLVIQF